MKNRLSRGKAERLRKTIDFQRVFSQGQSFKDGFFVFHVLKRPPESAPPGPQAGLPPGPGNRIGFVVSKRVSKKAVIRNRVRRRLREIYRQDKGKLKEGRDLVLVARVGAEALDFAETQATLRRLFKKAGLVKEER